MVRNSRYAPTNQRAAEDPQYLGDFYEENPNHQATRDQVAYLGPWFAFPGERGVRVTENSMGRSFWKTAERTAQPAWRPSASWADRWDDTP